jgi:hypothetical protein
MIRSLSLAVALVVGLALPAIAGPAAGNPFTMEAARQHLMHQGYTHVSQLAKDANGKWVGTATKDGKTVVVAVQVRGGATN